MSIFNEFFKKEKPVFTGIARGVGGFAFGTGASTGGTGGGGGVQASGGFLSEYSDGGINYVAHIFVGPGTFNLPSANAPNITNLEYLMVGGGGAGGDGDVGGGGGAGAYVKNSVTASSNTGSYAVEIGAGMPGSRSDGHNAPAGTTSIAFPGGTKTAYGGGAGGAGNAAPEALRTADDMGPTNGSAGGNGWRNPADAATTALATYPNTISDTTPALGWGGDGGVGPNGPGGGGGGGGAGGNGSDQAAPNNGGEGGAGLPSDGFSPTSLANGGIGIVAAGGGGGGDNAGGNGGSSNVGGAGAPPSASGPPIFPSTDVGYDAVRCTGSGGGGGGGFSFGRGGYGSNGVAIIRYQVPGSSGTALATGGLIGFNNGKCIHTFINPGSFVAPAQLTNVNYLMIGGGGAGSTANHGGGGGAGALIYKEGATLPAATYPITVGEGGNHGAPAGQSTTFNSLTAAGGAYGSDKNGGNAGVNQAHPGGIDQTTPDSGVGYPGGTAHPTYASGGGGASAVGVNGNTPPGSAGDGGDGARYTIHMGNESGTEIYYAGGGGGGGHTGSPSPKAAGGQGGGGEGGLFWNNPTPAPYGGAEAGDIGFPGANGTGGGAGGCGKYGVGGTNSSTDNARPATYAASAKGGSGIVIIAYPV